MAQDFRNAVARAQGTTAAAILTGGNYDAVIGIRCTNILTTTIKVDIYMVRSSANYYIAKSTPIPPGGSIELIQGGAKIVMVSGDVLIGLSTSGNSKNIINAFKTAKEKGIITIALTGESGGKLGILSNYLINIPSTDTPRIQEAHIMIGHIICELVESKLF